MVRCMHGYLGGGPSRISKLNHEDHKLSSQDRAKKNQGQVWRSIWKTAKVQEVGSLGDMICCVAALWASA